MCGWGGAQKNGGMMGSNVSLHVCACVCVCVLRRIVAEEGSEREHQS